MFSTPPIALDPYRSLAPPRSTSMRSIASSGSSSQWIHPPTASFSGTSSCVTSVRLADVDPSPRRLTPCDVGFATKELDRRNSSTPGSCLTCASTVNPAVVLSADCDSVLVVTGLSSDASGARYAVTVTCWLVPAGSSCTVRFALASTNLSANPFAATCSRQGIRQVIVTCPLVSVCPSSCPLASCTSAPAIAAPDRSITFTVSDTGFSSARTGDPASANSSISPRLKAPRSAPHLVLNWHNAIHITFASGLEPFKQLRHSLPKAWNQQMRCNLGEGYQYKRPFGHARVG